VLAHPFVVAVAADFAAFALRLRGARLGVLASWPRLPALLPELLFLLYCDGYCYCFFYYYFFFFLFGSARGCFLNHLLPIAATLNIERAFPTASTSTARCFKPPHTAVLLLSRLATCVNYSETPPFYRLA
jgi:hypothetical protein